VPIVAFVDDFFAAVPQGIAQSVFDMFKWFVTELLGFHLKTEKESPPNVEGTLLGVSVKLTGKGNGEFHLPDNKRKKYLARVLAILEEDVLTSGNSAKLAGSLSFASMVCLARFGRPFLQPLYGLAAGRVFGVDAQEFQPPQGKRGDKGLHPRVRWAVMWWVQILVSFPSRVFKWGTSHDRWLSDLFTDASAEERWEGLGAVLFKGSVSNASTMRVDDLPECLEPYLPSKDQQKVRVAQLEMLAVLLAIRTFGVQLRGSYCRIHVDNISAMYACLNGYSGNPYMARLAGEIWMELLRFDIAPWRQYVPSKLNVADVFSRPDKVRQGEWYAKKWNWRVVDPEPEFRPVARLLMARPEVAWGSLHTRLYGGRRP